MSKLCKKCKCEIEKGKLCLPCFKQWVSVDDYFLESLVIQSKETFQDTSFEYNTEDKPTSDEVEE